MGGFNLCSKWAGKGIVELSDCLSEVSEVLYSTLAVFGRQEGYMNYTGNVKSLSMFTISSSLLLKGFILFTTSLLTLELSR